MPNRIFYPYKQINQDYAGEGMGMIYVKTIVELHGGMINIQPEPGKGSIIMFVIQKKRL